MVNFFLASFDNNIIIYNIIITKTPLRSGLLQGTHVQQPTNKYYVMRESIFAFNGQP